MSRYYECHITMEGNPVDIRPSVENLKWKFSAIDGDPTLGDGIKCYATRHFNFRQPEELVLNQLNEVGDELERHHTVTRRKIELVLFDSRVDTVTL